MNVNTVAMASFISGSSFFHQLYCVGIQQQRGEETTVQLLVGLSVLESFF